ncbi:S8 family serine peptidase [uncultured Tenacibaculum sp.]|uniref:S8 family serine peptidase n=1 Tax=uncultured Tenacibaculum sp. TaxID=174713 RepID=UPI0026358888|nr:S8 family serine peptidase [uncultured Tenacibaculum sp.]
MKKINILLVSILFLFFNCSKQKFKPITVTAKKLLQKHIPLNNEELENWYVKDLNLDTIPGISLERAYNDLLQNQNGKKVLVAIIDTEIDIKHNDLEKNIWINNNEVPNNNIDDDGNGYIDDVNGWNFIGNLKNENILYSNLECVRVIQEYENKIKFSDSILLKKTNEFETYQKAKEYYKKSLKAAKDDQEYAMFLYEGYPKAKKALKKLFPKENYTKKELDSIYSSNKKKNKELAKNAYFLSDCIKYDISKEWIDNYKKNIDNKLTKTLNLNFFDKENIDKQPDNLGFIKYGNPYVNKNISEFYHGTLIAGLVSSKLNNETYNNIEIMPLAISSNGEEHDKDIALAIRYAVDNGAKVINMSFGKMFSLHKEWVFDAFKYAEENNVLIVSSAGNSNVDLTISNNYYPNDNLNNGKEIVNNFLLVGSISSKLDKSFKSYFSNYSNEDVDIFAPGEYIYTTLPKNKYKFDSGTSLASAITSKVAALIYSYYPNLSVGQVKDILMDSGLKYTFEVSTPIKKDKNKTTIFSKLSKSGKVLNAYNALIMADSISRN